MGERIRFTTVSLAGITPPQTGRDDWRDAQTPGLHVRVTPNGTKTFSWVRRTQGGSLERVTLGRWPEMSIDDARRHAARLNAAAADGESPAEQRREMKAEMTFADLFAIYLERWAKVRKKTWVDDESKFRIHLKPLHAKKLSAITRNDIARIHSAIGLEQPTFANRVLALVSKVFNVATEYGLWDGNNPASGIRHFKEQSRDRFLSGEEVQRFLEALAEERDILRAFFLVALLTGARRANVLAMRWADVDLERQVWKIPQPEKSKNVALVPLTPMVLEILAGLPHGVEWVFPSPKSKTGHLVEPRKAWERVLARAGIEDARIHDLRRTMGSWQAITGASLPIIGKSLGHASQQATAIYARLNLDPVRAAMEKATDAMMGKK
ncbi:MAG: tyrosine-type recombinase/integrase [Magnetococcales bacterium]|nr:tyrosine-type recombinase/integrase [Magnetococcales bacterium]